MGPPPLALALTVNRHEDGGYFWAILESFDRSEVYVALVEAAVGFPSYVSALQAGYSALLALADDADTGPLDDRIDHS